MSTNEQSKFEISKNLLQMGFMRRTLIAKQKEASNYAQEQLLPDESEYDFPIPAAVVGALEKLQTAAKLNAKITYVNSLFAIHNLPAGFRRTLGSCSNHPEDSQTLPSLKTRNDSFQDMGYSLTGTKKSDECHRRKRACPSGYIGWRKVAL